MFTGGHLSLVVAFKGPNVTLGPCKCNCSLTVKQELGAAAGKKQGGGPTGPCFCHLWPRVRATRWNGLRVHPGRGHGRLQARGDRWGAGAEREDVQAA